MNSTHWWGRVDATRRSQRLHLWSHVGDDYASACGLRHNATRVLASAEGLKCLNCFNYARAHGIEKAEQYQQFVKDQA
jgi:hypothetical protein